MEALSAREAFVAIAMSAAYSDGAMGAEEYEAFTEDLQSCRALRGVDESEIRAAMQKADRVLRNEGEGALLARASAALPVDLRPTAFCLGADVVIADDEVAPEERAFIDRLRRALGVDASLGERIVDVLLIRARA